VGTGGTPSPQQHREEKNGAQSKEREEQVKKDTGLHNNVN